MNAEELIDRVIETIDNPSYEDRDDILLELNRAQKTIADKLFLPDLKDGFDTVVTLTTLNVVDLPIDYHKGLYLAISSDVTLDIFKEIKSFHLIRGGISLEEGDLNGVVVRRGQLLYQNVPATATNIDLFYYRLPIDLTDATTSYPDGLVTNDVFSQALINHVCHKKFNIIEDGMEGAKINTAKHEVLFAENMLDLDAYAKHDGESFADRPTITIPWLGF